MRSLRFKLAVLLSASAGALACGDTRPCSNCPKMEGNWVFGYTTSPIQGTCDGVPAYTPPGTLTLTRAGAAIYSSTGGLDLSGTIYDDLTFVLRGTSFGNDGGQTTLYYRGEYVAGTAGADGGTDANDAQLNGTFTATVRAAQSECRMPSDYTAVR